MRVGHRCQHVENKLLSKVWFLNRMRHYLSTREEQTFSQKKKGVTKLRVTSILLYLRIKVDSRQSIEPLVWWTRGGTHILEITGSILVAVIIYFLILRVRMHNRVRAGQSHANQSVPPGLARLDSSRFGVFVVLDASRYYFSKYP
jgi:hypothetical protein